MNLVRELLRKVFTRKVLFHGIFWWWNLLFLGIVYPGLLPHVLFDILLEIFDGTVPLNLAFSAFLLCAIPLVCTLVGAIYFRREPAKLMRLFYGIEAPLLVAALVRLFLFRELPLAMGMVVVVFALCVITYGYELRLGEAPRGRLAAWAMHLGASLALLGCLYAASVFIFYAPPVAWAVVREFFRFQWLNELWRAFSREPGTGMIMVPLSLILFALSATLFAALPVVTTVLYFRMYRRSARALSEHAGRVLPLAATCLVVAVSTAVFVRVNHQPQRAVLKRLETPPQSDAERAALRQDAERLREGLLAAYLAPHRYMSAVGSNDHIERIYREVLHVPERTAKRLQAVHSALTAPILYDGASTHADREAAERHYESFFDTPIQKGDREAILHATQATFSRDQREAGLLNVGERKVFLTRQEVRVRALASDLAEIDLHEVYQNQTVEQQEIFYYFTLPESAVVTGLWLGDSDDRDKGFRFTISPRGAAQKVYRAEVRRRQDPALLEQLGPRQYRLRAFPIPPRERLHWQARRKEYKPAPLFHLFLTCQVLRGDGGGWPLPSLVERRNVYATAQTERIIDGARRADLGEGWLPASVPASGASAAQVKRLEFPGGQLVTATPLDATKLPLPSEKRYALVLDRSASMERHAAAVRELFAWTARELGAKNQLDVYLTAAPTRGEAPQRIDGLGRGASGFDASRVLYFGGQRASELLRQFADLRGPTSYAAVILITDDGSLDLARDKEPIHDFSAPVYVVHVGGVLSPGYDDATLASIQKRGGTVTTGIADVFRHLAARAQIGPGFVSLDSGYAFSVERKAPPAAPAPAAPAGESAGPPSSPGAQAAAPPSSSPISDPFAAILARQLILSAMNQADLGALQSLDELHRLAKTYGIVTPYSSMLVLVDERQREALRKAEQDADRFNREVESGNERVTTPSDLMVTGTPEPGEWLLLGLVALALAGLYLWSRSPAGRALLRPQRA
jgi:putative PEP-CTERM system integral membrane protein